MAMYPPIFSICKAAAAVTALIGLNPCRLYPFGEAPQSTVKPYAVWQSIGGSPENFMDRTPDADSFILQVDVYAETAAAARAVAEAIRDAVEPHAHISSWRGEGKDSETKLRVFSFDLSWIVRR